MEQVKLEFKYEFCDSVTAFPVIIVAAGSSTRMKGINKQLFSLCGMPVIVRTLMQFDDSPFVSRIILVVRKEDVLSMQQLISEYKIDKLTDIVEGGADRHASVINGISRLKSEEEKVMIHDGARPLVDNFVIGNVALALESCDAVICGTKIVDTVKRADENGNIIETVDRNGLFSVQTPQGINVKEYLKICDTLSDLSLFTDDAGIFEAASMPVKIVTGSPKNVKITTPDDIRLAELYLKGEEL
ncbi:MAG: 2-C-methyl-D-erythritol 4-phosphate cytidylyltransferase [Ruminococcaceae bacterium]|nr:2-C-methyl-D-erythritol 4-phosphate cytidylyltransferase [Oscillospiraceae bacterium]